MCPRGCEGCPDCLPFWVVDEEPVREIPGPGWAAENARLRDRADEQSRAIADRARRSAELEGLA